MLQLAGFFPQRPYLLVGRLETVAVWPGIETKRQGSPRSRTENRNIMPGQIERRMRDSNSRGVATNTLSKSVAARSHSVKPVQDAGHVTTLVGGERPRMLANETRTETRRALASGSCSENHKYVIYAV